MLRSTSDLNAPLYNRRAIQGVPPLTGDGSQFDAPLDHTDPGPLFDDRQTSMSSGGRTFAVAFAIITALLIGLIAGFAAGFFVAQQAEWIPAPRSAARAVAPVPTTTAQSQTYTDAPINDSQPPVGRAAPKPLSGEGGSGAPGEPDRARPTVGSSSGSLQIASRPTGAQVFVDDVRVGVTPMSLADVSAGSHRVRIELPGFRLWVTAVNVETGARARVGASLER